MKPTLNKELNTEVCNNHYLRNHNLCHNNSYSSFSNKKNINSQYLENNNDFGFTFNEKNVWFKNHPNTQYENSLKVFRHIQDLISKSTKKFRRQNQ